MNELFDDLLQIVTPIFAISSMGAVGLGNRPGDIVAPLRSLRLVAAALIASFVVVPLLTWAVTRLLALDAPFETGLILVSVAAGAPFLIKFVQTAGGDLALTAALLVLLLLATIVYMPLVLPLALEAGVEVDTATIAITLIWTMLLPMGAGLAFRTRNRARADWLRPILGRVSTTSLILLVLLTVLSNFDGILDIFGKGAILAAFLIIVGAFASGYLLGGPDTETRMVLGFATGQRNIAAATVVATQNFAEERDVLVMVVVAALVSLAVLFTTAFAMRGHVDRGKWRPRTA